MLSYNEIRKNEFIKTYIEKADKTLAAIGYTEHSYAHITMVANVASYILETLGYSEREIELVKIAGYMHDIGNLVNRADHAQTGALMAFKILTDLNMDPNDVSEVVSAIGHHDEPTAIPVNPITAALILGDKTDVRRSRVRNIDISLFDIHDRVNYSVQESKTIISDDKKIIELILTIDTKYCSVMDYFEIFLQRMLLCRKAADVLGLSFHLVINGQTLL